MNEFEASLKFWKGYWEDTEREGCEQGILTCPSCEAEPKMVWNEEKKAGVCPVCGWWVGQKD